MVIKKGIKKRYIFATVVLGVTAYWLSQNMWVFEKQIPREQYKTKIVGTWGQEGGIHDFLFLGLNKSTNPLYDKYFKNGEFKSYCLAPCSKNFLYTFSDWEISEDIITINYIYNADLVVYFDDLPRKKTEVSVKYKIIKLTDNYLITVIDKEFNPHDFKEGILIFKKAR